MVMAYSRVFGMINPNSQITRIPLYLNSPLRKKAQEIVACFEDLQSEIPLTSKKISTTKIVLSNDGGR